MPGGEGLRVAVAAGCLQTDDFGEEEGGVGTVGGGEVLTARQHLDRRLKVTYGLKD